MAETLEAPGGFLAQQTRVRGAWGERAPPNGEFAVLSESLRLFAFRNQFGRFGHLPFPSGRVHFDLLTPNLSQEPSRRKSPERRETLGGGMFPGVVRDYLCGWS
jgi:hypothetical protein